MNETMKYVPPEIDQDSMIGVKKEVQEKKVGHLSQEMIQKGEKLFSDFNEQYGQYFNKDRLFDMKEVFLGVSPSVWGTRFKYKMEKLDPQINNEIAEWLKKNNFLVILEKIDYLKKWNLSFLKKYLPLKIARLFEKEIPDKIDSVTNINAAKNIMAANQDFFPPESFSDPAKWLKENINQWSPFTSYNKKISNQERNVIETRYGLLSGFPKNSAMKFNELNKIRWTLLAFPESKKHETLIKACDFHNQSMNEYNKNMEENRENHKQQLMAYVNKKELNLTEEQIDLFLDSRLGLDFYAASKEDVDYRYALLNLVSKERTSEEMNRILYTH